ncbi:MAG: M56 family metallopeptidase [Gemmatimonadota bacterium]|nr:M56 family metallopeptidase [Gemmatimonadota bacterium]
MTAAALAALLGKGLVTSLVALVVLAGLRRGSAAVRHGVLATTFCVLLVLPIGEVALPDLALPVLPAREQAAAGPDAAADHGMRRAIPLLPAVEVEARGGSPAAVPAPGRVTPGARGSRPAMTDGPALLVLIWLAGVFLLTTRLLVDLARLVFVARRGARPPARWDPAIQRAARLLGHSRAPARVRISDAVPVAAVWGVLRPVVVLPEASRGWSAGRLEIVLTHEFAHVLRRDTLTTVVAELATAIHWPNPLAWVAQRRLRFERETACDEQVLRSGTARARYADELLAAARDLRGGLHPGVAMATRSGLHRRIERILSGAAPRRVSPFARPLAATVLLIGAPLLGACRLVPRAAETADADDVPPPTTTDVRVEPAAVDPGVPATPLELDVLFATLETGSRAARVRATWALGDLEAREAVSRLIGLLDDGDPEIRGMAAWSLGEIKDRASASALLERLADPDPVAREMFVRALGELRHPAAIPSLEALLADPDAPVRAAAVWALGEFGGAGLPAAIGPATRDRDVGVRKTAIQVLAESGLPAGDRALHAALHDDAPVIRAFAARQLADGTVDDVDPLLAALDDPAPEVRREVARTLGMIGDTRALDGLIAHLRDGDLEVRSWVVWALDEIDPEVDAAHPKEGFDRERLVGVTN